MDNKFIVRRLMVVAFAMGLYATKVITNKFGTETPMVQSEQTIEAAPEVPESAIIEAVEADNSVESALEEQDRKTEESQIATAEAGDDWDPTSSLSRLYGDDETIRPRHLIISGIKVDLAEIDLLVETEIAAGKLRSKKAILAFRQAAIDKKVQKAQAALQSSL